jgi:hypothetical protein
LKLCLKFSSSRLVSSSLLQTGCSCLTGSITTMDTIKSYWKAIRDSPYAGYYLAGAVVASHVVHHAQVLPCPFVER